MIRIFLTLFFLPALLAAELPKESLEHEDVEVIQILVNEIIADPANVKARQFLEFLAKERLIAHYFEVRRKRAQVIRKTLSLADKLQMSSYVKGRLAQELKILDPDGSAPLAPQAPGSPVPAGALGAEKSPADGSDKKILSDREYLAYLKSATELYHQGQLEAGSLALAKAMEIQNLPTDSIEALLSSLKTAALKEKARVAASMGVAATVPAAKIRAPLAQKAPALPLPKTDALAKSEAPPKIATASPADAERASRLFQQGVRRYSSGELERAVYFFRQSLELEPDNEWVKNSLERTLRELEQARPPVSGAQAKKPAVSQPAALPQEPQPIAEISEALALSRSGKHEQALRLCSALIVKDPDNLNALKTMAQIYEAQQDWPRAIESWRQAFKAAPQQEKGIIRPMMLKAVRKMLGPRSEISAPEAPKALIRQGEAL